jgi:hypothetical protein
MAYGAAGQWIVGTYDASIGEQHFARWEEWTNEGVIVLEMHLWRCAREEVVVDKPRAVSQER